MFCKSGLLATLFLHTVFAVPQSFPPPPQYPPVPLPGCYPPPSNNGTVPTRFALYGYSYDGSIVGQNYYSEGVPYSKGASTGAVIRPGDDGNNTYGSYVFSIGPEGHLFALNNGKVGTVAYEDVDETIGDMRFETWADWWFLGDVSPPPADMPTCTVVPYYNLLQCSNNGTPWKFAWCSEDVGRVIWGPDTSMCTEMVIRVEYQPKTFGDQLPMEYCKTHPMDEYTWYCPGNPHTPGGKRSLASRKDSLV